MSIRTGRRGGLLLALTAAGVSGLAVFVNGYAVKHVHATPTAYTTLKNMVAALLLVTVATARSRVPAPRVPALGVSARPTRGTWLGLGYVGLVGGGLAFALFFEGLARTSTTTAAFTQKTLVVWVIALAVPLLGEKVGPVQGVAVLLLLTGAVALNAGNGGLGLGAGPALVLAATVLWAVEVIVAKRLLASVPSLTVAVLRMAVGTVALFVWLALAGRLGQLGHLGRSGWAWVLLTGAILAVYVGVWFAALARARAVDVTAVLVSAAFITATLSASVQGTAPPHAWGLILVALGTVAASAGWRRSGLESTGPAPT
ncbi:MAG TPA: EamA family transporter [Acidimicrobiales bacterium]|nr:EamA family transporter [Acidimicrobiales bacterium]